MNLNKLYNIILNKKKSLPKNSYVSFLLKNEDKSIQKIGEEATEVIIAAKNKDKDNLIWELSDLFFHAFVLMVANNITLEDINAELEKRNK